MYSPPQNGREVPTRKPRQQARRKRAATTAESFSTRHALAGKIREAGGY
jgi:hypothetical protein